MSAARRLLERWAADRGGCGRHPGAVAPDRDAGLVRRLRRRARGAADDLRRRGTSGVRARLRARRACSGRGMRSGRVRSARRSTTPAPPSSSRLRTRSISARPPTAWCPACSNRTRRTRPRRCCATSTSTSRLRRRSSPPGGRWPAGGSPPLEASTRPRSNAYLAAGRHHAALGIVNPAVLPWRSEAAAAARRLGQLDRARALVDEELAIAERFGGPRPIAVARRAAGLLARRRSGRRAASLGRRDCSPAAAPAPSTPAR